MVCHPIFSWANCLRILGTKKHEKRGHIHCFYFSWFSTKNYGLEPVSTIVNRFKCSIFLILRLTVNIGVQMDTISSVVELYRPEDIFFCYAGDGGSYIWGYQYSSPMAFCKPVGKEQVIWLEKKGGRFWTVIFDFLP